MKRPAATASILTSSFKNSFSPLIYQKKFVHINLAFSLKNHFKKIFPLKKLCKIGMKNQFYPKKQNMKVN